MNSDTRRGAIPGAECAMLCALATAMEGLYMKAKVLKFDAAVN